MEYKKYTNEDLERLNAERDRIDREISEAKACIRYEKIGHLEEYWSSKLLGKLCIPSEPHGYGSFMYITSVHVDMDYRYEKYIKLDGLVLEIGSPVCLVHDGISGGRRSISVSLDEAGRMKDAVMDGIERSDTANILHWRIIDSSDLSNKDGLLKATALESIRMKHDDVAERDSAAYEKFRRDVRTRKKELEARLRPAEGPSGEAGQVCAAVPQDSL